MSLVSFRIANYQYSNSTSVLHPDYSFGVLYRSYIDPGSIILEVWEDNIKSSSQVAAALGLEKCDYRIEVASKGVLLSKFASNYFVLHWNVEGVNLSKQPELTLVPLDIKDLGEINNFLWGTCDRDYLRTGYIQQWWQNPS